MEVIQIFSIVVAQCSLLVRNRNGFGSIMLAMLLCFAQGSVQFYSQWMEWMKRILNWLLDR